MHIKRNASATIVSYPKYRIRRDREPSRISYKWVPDFLMEKNTEFYIKNYVPKSSKLKAMLSGCHRYNFLE